MDCDRCGKTFAADDQLHWLHDPQRLLKFIIGQDKPEYYFCPDCVLWIATRKRSFKMDRTKLFYRETHEWASLDGEIVTVGLSQYAIDNLTDLVIIVLPEVGKWCVVGESVGEVETVKAVSDIFSPVSGEIVEVNAKLAEKEGPLALLADPLGDAWLYRVHVGSSSCLDDLLDWQEYEELCDKEQERALGT